MSHHSKKPDADLHGSAARYPQYRRRGLFGRLIVKHVAYHDQILKGFIWFGLLVGMVFLSVYFWSSYAVAQAKKWPAVEATVTSSQVVPYIQIHNGRFGTTIAKYNRLDFMFTYMVAGHQYFSNRFYLWENPSVEWTASQYPVGRSFMAHYDPSDPAEAVAEPGTSSYFSLVMAVGFLVFFAPPLVYGLFQKFRHPRSI